MCELTQKIMHPLFNPRPVLHPTMPLEDVLAQPAPQFLDGIEPGRIGRQPDWGNAGVACQRGQHVGVRMDVPVVLAHLELVCHRIGVVQVGIELHHLLAPHDVAIEVVDLSGQGIERADRPPVLIVPRA
jgi:hypothetical protein